ncbi:MAG: hypothetical protein V1800_15055 [Candidatus Latescibacterota bacterium]
MAEQEHVNVHKDFHGAMSYGMQHVCERYGEEAMAEFLERVAKGVYGPLSERLKKEGLTALEEHWRHIFTIEEGDFDLGYEGDQLVLHVHQCPAIHHMQAHGYAIAERYCEHTRLVNEGICRAAGYECSVEYDQEKGRCVQSFWKES